MSNCHEVKVIFKQIAAASYLSVPDSFIGVALARSMSLNPSVSRCEYILNGTTSNIYVGGQAKPISHTIVLTNDELKDIVGWGGKITSFSSCHNQRLYNRLYKMLNESD